MFVKANVVKKGNKLGLYFPSKIQKHFNKGEVLSVTIFDGDRKITFLTKFNYSITLRRKITDNISLTKGETVKLKIKKPKQVKKPKHPFHKNKLDLLYFVPEKTERGSKIVMEQFEKNSTIWLRLWSYSLKGRGSSRQIKIKRYANIDTVGSLLGQIQAEGSKHNKNLIDFGNTKILEHRDFINSLLYIGIPKELIQVVLHYSNKLNNKTIKRFEKQTDIEIKKAYKRRSMKGKSAFITFVRSRLFQAIIINLLEKARNLLVKNKWDKNLKRLANAFFAKLLTGDGTLDIRTKNREFNFPLTRVKIADGDIQYLKNYARIMEKLGFKPKIREKNITVRAYADFKKLLYLYKIKAFKNVNNWRKLIVLIGICLKGRRLNTYLRFVDFLEHKTFTSLDLRSELPPT